MAEYEDVVTDVTIAVVFEQNGPIYYPCATNREIRAAQEEIRESGGDPVVFYRSAPDAVININSGAGNSGIQAHTVYGGVRLG